MLTLFLSYARSDGNHAAIRLRGELEAMGFNVWRDIEDMQGGLPWKEQIRAALRQVDVVLVLLTPAAVTSKTVEWEWENGMTLQRQVIGLLMLPCQAPDELKRLHYHDLSDPAAYTLGLAKLVRDLLRLATSRPEAKAQPAAAAKYQVIRPKNSAIGDQATVVNLSSSSQRGGREVDVARLLQVLRREDAPQDTQAQHEMAEVLREIQADVKQANAKLETLSSQMVLLLARYEQGEQRILAVLVMRLDAQELALTTAILDGLERRESSDSEIGRHLATVEAALQEVQQRAREISDQQLVASARQVSDMISAPEMDFKHKLKLTVPIIPFLLEYEGEVELSSRLNLEETWQALQRLVRRGSTSAG